MNGQHPPKSVRKWMGGSIGHWEGDTLVVGTTKFTDKEGFRGVASDAKIVDRFTRVGSDKVNYQFTMIDPAAFSSEIAFNMTTESIYEYACHDGNYALSGILAGARADEKIAATKQNGPK